MLNRKNKLNLTYERAVNMVKEMHDSHSETLVIPEQYDIIDNNVSFETIEFFEECKTVTLSSQIRIIPELCFAGTEIRNITMIGVEYIGFNAFENCEKLTDICAPNVKCVKESGFSGCKNLCDIFLPYLVSAETNAFGDTGIKRFDVPQSMLYMGGGAFTSQVTINLGSSTPFIEGNSSQVYYEADTENKKYSAVEGNLYSKDFSMLYSLYYDNTHKHIHPNTKIIHSFAFCDIKADNITIPESVSLIKEKAFCDAEIGCLEVMNRYVSFENNAGLARSEIDRFSFPNGHEHYKTSENYVIIGDELVYLKIRDTDLTANAFVFSDMPYFSVINEGAIHYNGNKKITVFLPNGIVKISGNSFRFSTNNNIVLPPSVSYIQYNSFCSYNGSIEMRQNNSIFYTQDGYTYETGDIFPLNCDFYRNRHKYSRNDLF